MIQSKNEIYTNRNNKKSKIFIEITEEVNDKENNQYIFNIVDYILKDEKKHIINTKLEYLNYSDRDNIKLYLLQNNEITGTESEINKKLIPLALLYLTIQGGGVYGTTEFELMP